MPQATSFMALPPELRERVYKYIALQHTTRRIEIMHSDNVGASECRITTSAMIATCRLIQTEYEDVARKAITTIEFTAVDFDFTDIIDYFHYRVDAGYLAILQLNKTTILVNLVIHNNSGCKFDMEKFYAWALFLVGSKLEAAYHSDHATWMDIFEATNPDLMEQCVVGEDSTQLVRDNIGNIRNIARKFDKVLWCAYPEFRVELQARRLREFDRSQSMGLAGEIE